MALEEFEKLDSIAGDANILNKTRFMLQEGREKLSDRERTILELAINFLDRLLGGYQYKAENRYVCNLIDSVNTYDSSRPALDRLKVENIKELVDNSKERLKEILESNSFSQDTIDIATVDLFKEVGSYLLHSGLRLKREKYLTNE